MSRTLGIINFEEKHVNVEGLSLYRPIPSISFCGRFRLIDFVLSNMSNSNISNIHIHVNRKPRSVYSHVGTGRHYNINSKRGKITIMHGEVSQRTDIYNTDINSFLDNLEFIVNASEEYVLIAPSYFVYAQNYREMIDHHIKSDADITVLYKSTDEAKEKFIECNTIAFDSNKQVTKIDKNMGRYKSRNILLDCYVMKKTLFVDLIRKAHNTSSLYWFIDIVKDMLDDLRIEAYSLRQEVIAINNLNQFYRAHMSMIDYTYARNFFHKTWPILTRTNDSPPVLYGDSSKIKNSSIANGSKIYGTVENCFIGRNVVIDKNAIVKNSVILAGVHIGEGAYLDHTVVDRGATVKVVKELVGSDKNIIYVNRYDVIWGNYEGVICSGWRITIY